MHRFLSTMNTAATAMGIRMVVRTVKEVAREETGCIFGGWGHAIVVELGDDMVSLKGEYKEITPEGYVEGPWMMKRNGVYYLMFSVGG